MERDDMSEIKAKNEKVKRKYFAYLKGAEGLWKRRFEAIEKARSGSMRSLAGNEELRGF